MGALGDAWTFLTTGANWTGANGLLARGRAHLWISVVSMLIATAIAAPIAVWLAHRRRLPVASVATANLARAIPSFAIVALVLPFSIRFGFGLGFWPTCVALVALAVPPIFTNTYTGVAATPSDVVEAARGIGMTDRQVLLRVELPFAMPLAVTGARIASVQIVATATLGALVGYQCLGSFIVGGLKRGEAGRPAVLGAAIVVAALALVIDLALGLIGRRSFRWRTGVRS